jgi:rhodanese-related sulfurtransferase
LIARFGAATTPLLIDVRREHAFVADEWMIAGAIRRPPETVGEWLKDLPKGREIVVYCIHGLEVGKGAAAALIEAGINASYLIDGIEHWRELGFPMVKKHAYANPGSDPSRWVTRERPKVDRIACPWLVARFVDPFAEFIYVPAGEVIAAGKAAKAIPYDVPGVEFTHVGDRCSFDAFIDRFAIKDPALDHLAVIVRGADTSRPDLAPQAPGLLALSQGLSAVHGEDDHAMLAEGMGIYDALYAWCRSCQTETHNWPPKMPAGGVS